MAFTRDPLTRAEVIKLLNEAKQQRATQDTQRQNRAAWKVAADKLEVIKRRLMKALPDYDSQNVGPGSDFAKENQKLDTIFHRGWVRGFDTVIDQICSLIGA